MDLNALRERLASLNRRAAKGNDIWKPKDEHEVRLLPYPHSDDPLVTLHFHYEIGDQSVLCPKANFGDECAICDFCEKLRSWKGPDGEEKPEVERKQDWEIFKKIQPKARVFVPMIERGKEGEGSKWWSITPNQAGELLNICADGDRLAELGIDKDDTANALKVIFDTKKAYDLKVSFAAPGKKGNTKTFGVVTFSGKFKATPLAKDAKAEKDILDGIKKITEVYPKVPSAEVAKMLAKFMGNSSSEASTEGGLEKGGSKASAPAATNSKEDAKVSGTRSLDEAFGDLIDEA